MTLSRGAAVKVLVHEGKPLGEDPSLRSPTGTPWLSAAFRL